MNQSKTLGASSQNPCNEFKISLLYKALNFKLLILQGTNLASSAKAGDFEGSALKAASPDAHKDPTFKKMPQAF